MTDIVLLSADRLTRAPLRAQLIEDGFDVIATDTWLSMRQHLRPGEKPRLAIVDLRDLDNPSEVLDRLRVLLKPDRVLVLTAAATIDAGALVRAGFVVVSRPVAIDKVVRAARTMLAHHRSTPARKR